MQPPAFKTAALTLLIAFACRPAWAERKALVIGNANYAEKRLPNPANDAEDMAAKLKVLGFRVIAVKDADKRGLLGQLESFRASLSPADDALVYYAGHGAQFQGINYLIPLNAAINRDEDLEYEAVDLKRVLNALSPVQTGLKLAILDACRNNPYPGSHRSGARGLARVEDVPNQTLLWFAASPGEEAEDGPRRNGLFTEQLLKTLDHPGLKVEEIFKQVARAVITTTQGKPKQQHPYPEGQTLVDFYFAEAGQTPQPVLPDPAAVELSFWDSVKNSDNPADFEEYLRQYPQGRFAGLAGNRLRRLQMAKIKTDSVLKTESVYPPKPAPQTDSVSKTESVFADFGIEMASLPGGTFQMGCGPKDGKCGSNEKPRHQVTVRSFAIGKTEVTQGQWKQVMGSYPPKLHFKDCGDDCPVENVSWNDAQAFIAKLNAQTQGGYRLPTEAEWEYACRAGKETLYCGGDDADRVAWYWDNAGKTTHPVKGKQPNAFGLYDMSGNVYEWVRDCYHDSYQGAPVDGSAWDGGRVCASNGRRVRGGSWDNGPLHLRSAFRGWLRPDGALNYLGFRLASAL